MTRFEKIKNLNMEQVIEFLQEYIQCMDCPVFTECYGNSAPCEAFLKKWLNGKGELI